MEDALRHIFDRLSLIDRIRIERVSRQWQRLSRLSWKREHTLQFHEFIEDSDHCLTVRDAQRVLLALLQRAGPTLLYLDISQCLYGSLSLDLSPKCLTKVGSYCPQLISLDLSFTSLSSAHMNVLVDVAFSQIQVLKLVHCFQDRSHFCEDDLGAVFASLQQLTDIDLNQNDYLTGSCLLLLSVKLKRLSIGKCFGIEHSYLRQMATKCTLISFFDFEQCHLADMDQVFAHWPLLRELKLSNFGTSMNVNVFQNLQQLVLFHFSHCRFTTNQLIAALSDSCPLLEDLDLSGYEIYDGETGAIDYRPLGRLQRLRHVDLSWHERMTDDDLGAIVCGGRLETLRLHLCCKLTSNGLIDAVDKCSDLRQLDVTGMDDSFQFVALSFLHVVSVVTDEQVYRRWPLQLTLDRKSRLQIAKCQQFCHHNLLVRLS